MNPADKARLELLEEFRRGTTERIEEINLGWIALEKSPEDAEASANLARQLHTLKGEAKMMGFADVSLVAHRAEELVLHARQRGFDVPDAFGDLLLAATDTIGSLIYKKAGSTQATIDLAALFDRFDALLERSSAAADVQPKLELPVDAGLPRTVDGSSVSRVALEQFLRIDRDAIAAFSELASETVIAHARYEDALGELKKIAQETYHTLGEIEIAQALGSGSDGARPHARGIDGADSVALTALRRFYDRFENVITPLVDQMHAGHTRARDLDRQARQLRLVPIVGTLKRYVRAVRDLAQEHGKMVAVHVDDSGVSVDKLVVDKIAEPILHLVRNSVDHGLESPEQRREAGKPETGQVRLIATQEGGFVTVAVEDDGHGIDPAAVRRRAVELGLVGAERSSSLSDEELLGLLFRSGFSTRSVATETSGRGVGLDVVKREVELLGGTVRVLSEVGQGTRTELRVPISVALTRVLVVRGNREFYAIPSSAIDGVMVVPSTDTEMVNNRRSVRFGGVPLPLTSLGELMESLEEPEWERVSVVVVRHGEMRVALSVCEWRREIDVIQRPLGELLAPVHLFAGGCMLEDGTLTLVLNAAELVSRALGAESQTGLAAVAPVGISRMKRILLAEDSAITRAMVARVLRAFGYDVSEAEDGEEAFHILLRSEFDLILTDIEMPRLGGVELIERVRSEERWRTIPIVVLSTRGSEHDKSRALQAGADAYLVKTEFSEASLREAIERRLGA